MLVNIISQPASKSVIFKLSYVLDFILRELSLSTFIRKDYFPMLGQMYTFLHN